jgi:hypothetical protein
VLAAADSAVRALHVTRRVTLLQLQLLALHLAAQQQCRQSSTKPAAAVHDTAAAAQQQQQQLVTEIETGTGDAPVTVTLTTVTATGTVRNVNRSALHRSHGVLTTDGATAVCLALTHALTHAATLALMHAVIHAVIHADHHTMTQAVLLLVVVAARSSSSSNEGVCTAQQGVTRIAVRADLLVVQHSHSHSSSQCLQGDARMMTLVVLVDSSSSNSTSQAAGYSSYSCRAVETGTKSVLVVTEAVIEIVNPAGKLKTEYTDVLTVSCGMSEYN